MILAGFFSTFLAGIWYGILILNNEKLEDKQDIPKCKCSDVNQCDTWCIAKENFKKYHG